MPSCDECCGGARRSRASLSGGQRRRWQPCGATATRPGEHGLLSDLSWTCLCAIWRHGHLRPVQNPACTHDVYRRLPAFHLSGAAWSPTLPIGAARDLSRASATRVAKLKGVCTASEYAPKPSPLQITISGNAASRVGSLADMRAGRAAELSRLVPHSSQPHSAQPHGMGQLQQGSGMPPRPTAPCVDAAGSRSMSHSVSRPERGAPIGFLLLLLGCSWTLCYSHPAMIGRVSRPWAGGTRDQGASREGVDHGAPSPWLRPPSPQLSVPGSPHPGPAPRPAGHATPTTWWGTWGSLAA